MMNSIQPLDLIFRYNVLSKIDILIAQCGLNYADILVNHVGLCLNDTQIIEANNNGVVINSVANFMQGNIYIKRLNFYLTDQEIKSIIQQAKGYLDTQYNSTYTDTTDTIYCSELVINAFAVLANNPFCRHPITFKNPITQKIDENWYKIIGEQLPEGELGSHPASLFTSSNLTLVYSS